MNLSKSNRAWRPHMSSDAEFNPFVHITGSDFDRRTLDEMDEHDSEEREIEAEPMKIVGD
jgi:hypothetical protein